MIDLFSAVLYTAVFTISILLFHLSENNKKNARVFFAGTAILLLCLLAGGRDNSVGRDINNYVDRFFHYFHSSSSFEECLNYINNSGFEPLYVLLLYITSRFTDDLWLILFCFQVLTIFPVYRAVLKWNKECNISIAYSMAVYIFVFYNNSYNIMRQSISAAFIFLGTTYLLFYTKMTDANLKKRDRRIIVVSFICAYLFHKSALIGIAIILLAFVFKKASKKAVLLLSGGCIGIYYSLQFIFTFLINKIEFSRSFTYYINVFILQTNKSDWMQDYYTYLMYFDFLSRTLIIFIPFIVLSKGNEEEHYLKTLTMLGYITYALPWLTMKTVYGQRLSLYSDFFLIALIPYWSEYRGNNKNEIKKIGCILMWCYWFIWILYFKWADAGIYNFRF